jgi:hypothetical protein
MVYSIKKQPPTSWSKKKGRPSFGAGLAVHFDEKRKRELDARRAKRAARKP